MRPDNPQGPDLWWVEVPLKRVTISVALITWFPTMTPRWIKGVALQTENIHAAQDVSAKGRRR